MLISHFYFGGIVFFLFDLWKTDLNDVDVKHWIDFSVEQSFFVPKLDRSSVEKTNPYKAEKYTNSLF